MKWTRGPVIGRGSSATVYLATTAAGNPFAVKSSNLNSSVFLQKEHLILSQLNSPHIIQHMGYDINHIKDTPMFNLHMEYAPGGSISDAIKKQGGSLQESLIRSYTRQILLGLDHIHSNCFVHCDLKCGNILICENGVKIGDFGCAKSVENRDSVFSGTFSGEFSGKPVLDCDIKSGKFLIGENGVKIGDFGCAKSVENRGSAFSGEFSGAFSGTPIFMAPEVVRGEEQGFASDVWALGCVVIEMATGFNPWPEVDDPISGLYRIGYSGEVPELPRWLSPEGQDFLACCLKRDARERYGVKELLKHPFVVGFDKKDEEFTQFRENSPTSVLNQDFWGCLEVAGGSPESTRTVDFSGEYPVERIRQLINTNHSCLPKWIDEEDWITIRSNHIEERL